MRLQRTMWRGTLTRCRRSTSCSCVLAAETVAREAAAAGIAPTAHLQHLVVHGLLHLLGHRHDSDAEAEAMEAMESAILAAIGVADPHRAY